MSFFKRIYLTPWFLVFVLVFAYAQSVQGRILVRQSVNLYTFTPEAALFGFVNAMIIFSIMGFIIIKSQKPIAFPGVKNIIFVFSVSLLFYLGFANLLSYLVALGFDTVERNFAPNVVISTNISYVINVCIYGGFFLAHYYFKKDQDNMRQLEQYNSALARSKLNKLKTQLNPHFLFNSLNALDQLIEEDQTRASEFLNDFAELYRYVLNVSDRNLVDLDDELDFALSYFNIMDYKYKGAFTMQMENTAPPMAMIPPLSLQLLLENVFKHNMATPKNPVEIRIEVNDKVRVSNTHHPKSKDKRTGGVGLQNLIAQYQLLSSEKLEICCDAHMFSVSLPVIFKAQR